MTPLSNEFPPFNSVPNPSLSQFCATSGKKVGEKGCNGLIENVTLRIAIPSRNLGIFRNHLDNFSMDRFATTRHNRRYKTRGDKPRIYHPVSPPNRENYRDCPHPPVEDGKDEWTGSGTSRKERKKKRWRGRNVRAFLSLFLPLSLS